MKRTRAFRPSLHSVEDRILLSNWFTGMIHSLLPFIPDKSRPAKINTAALRSHLASQQAQLRQHAQATVQARRSTDVPAGPAVLRAHGGIHAAVMPVNPAAARLAASAPRAARLH